MAAGKRLSDIINCRSNGDRARASCQAADYPSDAPNRPAAPRAPACRACSPVNESIRAAARPEKKPHSVCTGRNSAPDSPTGSPIRRAARGVGSGQGCGRPLFPAATRSARVKTPPSLIKRASLVALWCNAPPYLEWFCRGRQKGAICSTLASDLAPR